jgi:bifunctional polynucleotide phosphatase/kinase
MNKSKKWIVTTEFTFLNNLPYNNSIKYEKIILFDLDGTIIKTKSGKVHPINSDDWIFNYTSVLDKFKKINNNVLLGIISNQKGLKSNDKLIQWQNKVNEIMKQINFHFIFGSLKDDRYRKPMIGSWEYIKNNYLKELNINLANKIIYVGDACGRDKDFSDTDLKFAYNCNFKFFTPEVFFEIICPKETMSITYPILTYYSKENFNQKISKLIKSLNREKVLILMIGLPACGKSFMRKFLINSYPNFKYFNKDDIKNKLINNNLINKHDPYINHIIDDNTNTTLKSRNELSKIYNTHYKIAIYFDYEIDIAMHLNYIRMYWYGAELIKKVAYFSLNKKFDKPNDKEFDLLIKFDEILPDFNLEHNFKYYF